MRTRRTTIKARAKSDGLRLLRTINHTQAHGEEGARTDPTRAAHQAGLDLGSERYEDAMAYLVEQAALLADARMSFGDDVGDQHPHGYASFFSTRGPVPLRGLRHPRLQLFTQRVYQKIDNLWFVGSRYRHNHSRLCTLDAACRTYHVRKYLPCSWRWCNRSNATIRIRRIIQPDPRDSQGERGALPPPGRGRQGLRHLHARRRWVHHNVEHWGSAHQGLRVRGDHRGALLDLLHR